MLGAAVSVWGGRGGRKGWELHREKGCGDDHARKQREITHPRDYYADGSRNEKKKKLGSRWYCCAGLD